MFFVQNGLAAEAFIVPNEHGALELSSIIINGGAALLLGAGWLFPGRLTRRQALVRSARHSMLVFMSTLPVIFIAAFIESYVTRHTEWPMPAKLAIIFVSLFFIVGYYVVLPVIAKRHHHNS
ncbi:MAG: stage II sporulation protein M, partial [Muribaculaceae bacterium]|nr:stage II sporulation protein M [Muribaculaceae bacterium]